MACEMTQPVFRQRRGLLEQRAAACDQRGCLQFFGRTQQREFLEKTSQGLAAAEARQGDRKKQAEQRRRDPGEQRWREKIHDHGGDGAQQHVAPMEMPGIAPAGAA